MLAFQYNVAGGYSGLSICLSASQALVCHHCSHAAIRQWQQYAEVLHRVLVVQMVVVPQELEPAEALHKLLARHMHIPVHIFVNYKISNCWALFRRWRYAESTSE